MESFSKKRPNFNEFKDWFMEEVQRCTKEDYANSYLSWSSVGSEEMREEIIESFMQMLDRRFGFRPLIEERLSTNEGAIESIVIRIYHVFSTMFLVDHINEKMYGKRSKQLN